ncbi:MAG: hypothetical protein ACYSSI_01065 [Planctomycetota bacterium]
MKASKKCLMIVMAMALVGTVLYVNGCKKKSDSETKEAASGSVPLCLQCGQIKGSTLCCKPNQTKCSGCSLVKGSPGCCKIPKDAKTAAICTKCGQIEGTALCCKPNQTKCSGCGLVKASPGCCKIPK